MRYIKLSQGKCAIVDDDMYEYLNQWKWHAIKGKRTFYAVRNEKSGNGNGTILMHRIILDAPQGMETDHINHNGLDNRKVNLRICTHRENLQNQRPRRAGTSKYKGVSRNKGSWTARIVYHGVRIYLGTCKSELIAARTYDATAKELFGAFAYPNFPD